MSSTQRRVKNHKYLVCAIYDGEGSIGGTTRIEHVKIVTARSPFSAKLAAKKNHNPEGEKPTSYVASLILGSFKLNASSHKTHTCEELLSIG